MTATVPRMLHRVWVGSELPDWAADTDRAWRAMLPDWQHRLWSDADLPDLPITAKAAPRCPHPVVVSDLARAEILWRHGGVYLDADMTPLRSLDGLLGGPWVVAEDDPGWPAGSVSCGAAGFAPEHDLPLRALELGVGRLSRNLPVHHYAGPPVWTLAARLCPQVRVLAPAAFYPLPWRERKHVPTLRRWVDADLPAVRALLPGTYGVHEWAGSWR